MPSLLLMQIIIIILAKVLKVSAYVKDALYVVGLNFL